MSATQLGSPGARHDTLGTGGRLLAWRGRGQLAPVSNQQYWARLCIRYCCCDCCPRCPCCCCCFSTSCCTPSEGSSASEAGRALANLSLISAYAAAAPAVCVACVNCPALHAAAALAPKATFSAHYAGASYQCAAGDAIPGV